MGKTALAASTVRGNKLLASCFGRIIAGERAAGANCSGKSVGGARASLDTSHRRRNFCHRGEWNQNPSVAKLSVPTELPRPHSQ